MTSGCPDISFPAFVEVQAQLDALMPRNGHVAFGRGDDGGLAAFAGTMVLVQIAGDDQCGTLYLDVHVFCHSLNSLSRLRTMTRWPIIFPPGGVFLAFGRQV